jgi:hypothetical protein
MQEVQKLLSAAAGYLQQLRPVLTALAVLPPTPTSDAVPTVPGGGDSPAAPRDSYEPSERQDTILAAMSELGAVGFNSRKTRQAIAGKVQRGLSAASIGADCATLKEHGYVDSQEGSKGGCWLTAKGIGRAKQFLSPSA